MESKFSADFGTKKQVYRFYMGCRVSFKPVLLKASFPEEFSCEKKVSLTRWLSLKVSFPVNSGRRKEVSGVDGARGVYKFSLKVSRETGVISCNSYKITCVQGNSGRCAGLRDWFEVAVVYFVSSI